MNTNSHPSAKAAQQIPDDAKQAGPEMDMTPVETMIKFMEDDPFLPWAVSAVDQVKILLAFWKCHSAPDDGKGQPVAVREGESLWLIEQTGRDGIRRFWAGFFWTTNALEAVRFVKYSDAHSLVCRPFWKNFSNAHPDEHEPVEVCEHLFQCGVSATHGWQQGAALEICRVFSIQLGETPGRNSRLELIEDILRKHQEGK